MLQNAYTMIWWVRKICGDVYSYKKSIDAQTEEPVSSLKAYT